MRYSSEHKDQTYRQLLTAAARAVRRDGPERIGVAAIMAEVGLTHGGFYAHFKSKDDLIVAAIDEMFDERERAFAKRVEGLRPREALSSYIDSYLSAGHCESIERGCPLPTLAGDAPRLGPIARKHFSAGTERLRRMVSTLFDKFGYDEAAAIALATSLLSEMSGAIAMARATSSAAKAREICDQAREAIKNRLGLADEKSQI
jgi:TetR/AcrR family transcriptional regulator, transcriptional repressor for nem operon